MAYAVSIWVLVCPVTR